MAIEVKCVQTDSFEMRYFTFGEGKRDLVIIPGLSLISVMNSADAIASAYDIMAKEFKVWVFDRRLNLPREYSVDEMAEDTAKAMKALDIKDACVFGTSQGGMMAQLIAENHPELVYKLALGSTISRLPKLDENSVLGRWIHLAQEGKIHKLNLSFSEMVYSPATFMQFKDVILGMEKDITKEDVDRFIILAKGTEGFNAYDDLDRITCPVWIAGSEQDKVLGFTEMKVIAAKTGGELYLYKDYGHAVYDEAPDFKERLYHFFVKRA